MPKSTGWHPADIVAAIHKKGTTLTALARKHGKADSTLRSALCKPARPSNRIIANFLATPLHVLWPAWFDRRGRLLPNANPAKARRPASSQKRIAA